MAFAAEADDAERLVVAELESGHRTAPDLDDLRRTIHNAISSALCAFASQTATVIAARAFMGIGAAIIVPLTLAMLPVLFAPEERGRALAFWSMGSGVGLPLGPILGGWLLEHYWWGSIFFISVPVLAVVVVAAYVLLPESRAATPRRLDIPGCLLSVAGLVAFVYGVIEGPEKGWTKPAILGALVVGVVLLAGFAVWERVTSAPMVDLTLLTKPRFLWPTVAVTLLSIWPAHPGRRARRLRHREPFGRVRLPGRVARGVRPRSRAGHGPGGRRDDGDHSRRRGSVAGPR